MRRVLNSGKKIFLCLALCVLVLTVVNAQPGNPAGDPDVPISGIEILLAAGGVAGLRKWYVSRKKSN
jgi:hypothetical protein